MSELICGFHSIITLLKTNPERIFKIYILKNNNSKRLNLLKEKFVKLGIIFSEVNKDFLNKKANGVLHQGCIAKIKEKEILNEKYIIKLLLKCSDPIFLILDRITDPHNLGACLRSADAAGVNAVIIPKRNSAPLNTIAKKVSSGASETVPIIRVTNLINIIRIFIKYNVWIIGTSSEVTNLFYTSKFLGSIAIIMGSEEKGIRRIIKEHCHEIVHIPMNGSVSSLNVSVATGIILFEAIRQRKLISFL